MPDYKYRLSELLHDVSKDTPWTLELQQAVESFLTHECPGEELQRMLPQLRIRMKPDLSRFDHVNYIVEHNSPFAIRVAFEYPERCQAVIAHKTLDPLLDGVTSWQPSFDPGAYEWLSAHASFEQLADVADLTGHSDLVLSAQDFEPDEAAARTVLLADLYEVIDPPELLDAWRTGGH